MDDTQSLWPFSMAVFGALIRKSLLAMDFFTISDLCLRQESTKSK